MFKGRQYKPYATDFFVNCSYCFKPVKNTVGLARKRRRNAGATPEDITCPHCNAVLGRAAAASNTTSNTMWHGLPKFKELKKPCQTKRRTSLEAVLSGTPRSSRDTTHQQTITEIETTENLLRGMSGGAENAFTMTHSAGSSVLRRTSGAALPHSTTNLSDDPLKAETNTPKALKEPDGLSAPQTFRGRWAGVIRMRFRGPFTRKRRNMSLPHLQKEMSGEPASAKDDKVLFVCRGSDLSRVFMDQNDCESPCQCKCHGGYRQSTANIEPPFPPGGGNSSLLPSNTSSSPHQPYPSSSESEVDNQHHENSGSDSSGAAHISDSDSTEGTRNMNRTRQSWTRFVPYGLSPFNRFLDRGFERSRSRSTSGNRSLSDSRGSSRGGSRSRSRGQRHRLSETLLRNSWVPSNASTQAVTQSETQDSDTVVWREPVIRFDEHQPRISD